MPFIHVYALRGRDMETKKKAAQAIVKTASEAMGAPESVFTLVYEELEREAWQADVAQAIIEPLRDKILIENGEPVN